MSGQNTRPLPLRSEDQGHATNLTHLLARFRHQVEHDAGQPIEALDLNAALLLSDLCRFLELSDEGCGRVLGDGAAAFVGHVETQRVGLQLCPSPESLVA